MSGVVHTIRHQEEIATPQFLFSTEEINNVEILQHFQNPRAGLAGLSGHRFIHDLRFCREPCNLHFFLGGVIMNFANDNNATQNKSWQNDTEVRGFDPRLIIRVVTEAQVRDDLWRANARAVMYAVLHETPYRKRLDHLMDFWAKWPGRFVDGQGQEVMFCIEMLNDIPDEWFRDYLRNWSPGDPAPKFRSEALERLIAIFSILKLIKPADMALCGQRHANDN